MPEKENETYWMISKFIYIPRETNNKQIVMLNILCNVSTFFNRRAWPAIGHPRLRIHQNVPNGRAKNGEIP